MYGLSCKESRTFYLFQVATHFPLPRHYQNLVDDLRSQKVHSKEDKERNPAPNQIMIEKCIEQ
ncbi:hypothetical protein SADUNF_SadunfUnG0006600 [Salix dunnii]|uniref:Uncharacterized protein n=1 Tax=Salix dunnii TaxID=1413687 RepID=A0A835MH07_9ROSI|nr:hypothetical protein SADUNF_SadunfUnG0006600 [Salix dunnii]